MAVLLSNLRLQYAIIIQEVNQDEEILSTTPKNVVVPLPNGIQGSSNYSVPAGAVDQPLSLITDGVDAFADFVFLYSDSEISVKFQDPAAPPLVIRAGGSCMLDSKSITQVLVSNGGTTRALVLFQQARWQAL